MLRVVPAGHEGGLDDITGAPRYARVPALIGPRRRTPRQAVGDDRLITVDPIADIGRPIAPILQSQARTATPVLDRQDARGAGAKHIAPVHVGDLGHGGRARGSRSEVDVDPIGL